MPVNKTSNTADDSAKSITPEVQTQEELNEPRENKPMNYLYSF